MISIYHLYLLCIHLRIDWLVLALFYCELRSLFVSLCCPDLCTRQANGDPALLWVLAALRMYQLADEACVRTKGRDLSSSILYVLQCFMLSSEAL